MNSQNMKVDLQIWELKMIKIYNSHVSDIGISYVVLAYPQDIFHNVNQGHYNYWIEWGSGGIDDSYL